LKINTITKHLTGSWDQRGYDEKSQEDEQADNNSEYKDSGEMIFDDNIMTWGEMDDGLSPRALLSQLTGLILSRVYECC